MDLNEIRSGLEILMYYNAEIRHRLINLRGYIDSFLRAGEFKNRAAVIDLCRSLRSNIQELLRFLELEEDLENVISRVDPKIYRTLKDDIKRLKRILEQALLFINRLLQSEEFLGRGNNAGKIKQLIEESEQILSKDIYTEKLLEEIIDFAKAEWERNIKNKFVWLYHGTSILFLPYIQKYGLDSSKLPKGIKRGVETLSNMFAKYGVPETKGGGLDIELDVSTKGISLVWTDRNIRVSAAASNLPAFMYELFDEEHLRSLEYAAEVIQKLSTEDAKIFRIIMRFGRVLRGRNKVVLLRIKVDSEFVKYLGLPDFISDYDSFFFEYFVQAMNFNELLQDIRGRKNSVSYLCSGIEIPFMRLYERNKLGTRDLTGIRLQAKPIQPQFIYLEVQTTTGYSLINISQWNENMTPRIV
ncbi:hypothetical protein HYV82_00925 [Candidatus Woesearchaeota archaeon]|nr:hypothetical protein [Candidatus Woesearchaeota archaeon]